MSSTDRIIDESVRGGEKRAQALIARRQTRLRAALAFAPRLNT
jgi:hypothetical protein